MFLTSCLCDFAALREFNNHILEETLIHLIPQNICAPLHLYFLESLCLYNKKNLEGLSDITGNEITSDYLKGLVTIDY